MPNLHPVEPVDPSALMAHLPKKRTMIKDRVGCVRSTVYSLPGQDFVYGKPNGISDEGAGDIISNWVTSDPSTGKESNKLIVFSNILAIKNGCVTARAIRRYAMDHPNIRRKEALPSDSSRGSNNVRFEGPFGRKTVYATEPIGDILQSKFTNYSNDDADYPNVSSITKTGFMPKPRPTVASEGVLVAREKAKQKAEKPHFVMKRFQKVKATFHLPNQEVPGIPKKPHGFTHNAPHPPLHEGPGSHG